jgi:hypothetical protein
MLTQQCPVAIPANNARSKTASITVAPVQMPSVTQKWLLVRPTVCGRARPRVAAPGAEGLAGVADRRLEFGAALWVAAVMPRGSFSEFGHSIIMYIEIRRHPFC